MDKTQIKRHDLVFISAEAKISIWKKIAHQYDGLKREMVGSIFWDAIDIPGIARRSDIPMDEVPIGFVHAKRLDGNRIRVGCSVAEGDINAVLNPYEVLRKATSDRTACMEAALSLAALAKKYQLQVGVLGSAGLEIATGLPYTDEASDLDFLIKPAEYLKLESFYAECRAEFKNINMDFELELPNGYGVKLAEIFMQTRTVLGKSIKNVDLLYKKDIMQYLT